MKGSIEIVEGNILKTTRDIIVQQVNCKGYMGAGLSGTIMKRYGNVEKEYKKFRNDQVKDLMDEKNLLGMVNYVDVYDGKIIANVFGQVGVRNGVHDKKVYTDKNALLKGIKEIKEKAEKLKFSVAIPTYIGCGLAGGNWEDIHEGIEEIFKGSSVDVVFYHYR